MLKSVRTGTVDVVLCDPIYPEVDRKGYPKINESDWHALMQAVVKQCRRVVKPKGSAVFILQPNSKRLGQMRLWLWEFLIWAAKEWNLVQDVHWWAVNAMPVSGNNRKIGLLRPSVKFCVWLGSPDCVRFQDRVLWTPSDGALAQRRSDNALRSPPSEMTTRRDRMVAAIDERGGSTPFNLLPLAAGGESTDAGDHPTSTPYRVVDWWCRYLLPSGGVLLDPFVGSGTTLVAGLDNGASKVIGIDREAKFLKTARRRIANG
jgi:DNA modification methylase